MSIGALPQAVGGDSAHRLRKKLWLGAWALTVLVLTIVIGNMVIDREKAITADAVGHDFLAFYTAGHFVREGRAAQMYELELVREFQRQMGEQNGLELKKDSFGPFWNPPFYAWVFVPLAGLPFRVALSIWWGLNLVCLAGAMVLMCRLLPRWGDWRVAGLVPAILLNSLPFHQALNHGQNTFTSLLFLTLTVTLWMRGKAFWAGIVCGLLFYKPQLGALVAMILIVHQGWRALVGVAATGLVLLGITLLTMPGIVAIYLAKMPENLTWMQEANSYLWERHVTLKAFWRLMIQGHALGETSMLVKSLWIASVVGLGGALAAAVYRTIRFGGGESRSAARLICAAIVAMPLLMPFYFDYDLLLLSVAAALFAADVVAQGGAMTPAEKWLTAAWVVLFVVMFFNAPLSGVIRVHLAVIALSVVAGLHIRRAWKSSEIAELA